jgi:molybdate transport system substrate-binding protein
MSRLATAAVVVALSATACGTTEHSGGSADRRLTVLAAASLTEPFTEIATAFEAQHAGVDVVTSFDSSATIATQVSAGAPVDVVATADPRTMALMGSAVEDPVIFAHNVLALVVPPDNPAGIDRPQDLRGTDFVVCAATAPCGRLAAALLDEAGVTTQPRSLEVDVKAVLTKVMLGEADAGLVYATDVIAAKERVDEVALAERTPLGTDYPVAVTTESTRPALAQEFVDLLLSREGRQILAGAGFTEAGTP